MSQPALPTGQRLRWYQYSLRSFLIFICLIGCVLGWIAREREQSKRELAIADEFRKQSYEVMLCGPYDTYDPSIYKGRQAWWRNLTRLVLGERILSVDTPFRPEFKDLTPFGGLKNLRELYIHTAASDLTPFDGALRFESKKVHDLTPLNKLKKLQTLDLHCSSVHDLTPLAGFKNLEELNLFDSQVSDLTPLVGLNNLQELHLLGTQVKDLTPLARLTNLQELNLVSTQVTDLRPLHGLRNLKKLDVRSTKVTKEQIDAMQKALPKCKIDHDPFPEK